MTCGRAWFDAGLVGGEGLKHILDVNRGKLRQNQIEPQQTYKYSVGQDKHDLTNRKAQIIPKKSKRCLSASELLKREIQAMP